MAFAHNVISGSYSVQWGGVDIGLTEEGWFIEITHKGEPVTLEEYGETPLDMIHRGADMTVEAVLKQWNAAALQTALWPWADNTVFPYATTAEEMGHVPCIGGMAVANKVSGSADPHALPLVMTADACGPAGQQTPDEAGPSVITFHRAIMAPEVASRINFNNRPRLIPIRFQIFMVDPLGDDVLRFFTIDPFPP